MTNKTKTLLVVLDVSGSMVEMGKLYIQRNISRYIIQAKTLNSPYENVNIRFFGWREEIFPIELLHEDLPIENNSKLTPCGRAQMHSLITFSKSHPDSSILLLSDGYWEETKTKESIQNLLVAIAVGADANITKLEKIFKDKKLLFLPEEVACALDILSFTDSSLKENKTQTKEILAQVKQKRGG